MRFLRTAKKPYSYCKTIVFGGEAGEGVKSAGYLIALSLGKSKLNTFVYDEYPSLIRGGHNSVNITYSPYNVYSPNREIDILVCLDRVTFDYHKLNLHTGSVVIYDKKSFTITNEDLKDLSCELIEIPVSDIISQKKLPVIVQNTILAVSCLCIVGIKEKFIKKAIIKKFEDKPEFLEANLMALAEGYANALEYFNFKGFSSEEQRKNKKTKKQENKKIEKQKRYLLTGNEALSLGAIRAGIGFFAAYPMTPASSILTFMAQHAKKYEFIAKQTEDEISAINMAIGASYAGARSMTATSGGGFSLMVEGLGLAAITETPIVIALVQRPGPATGLPTFTAQSDLLFALYASQDEFPRIILTPTDAEECFTLTFKAFNLAEQYQIPVIIVSDKFLAESSYTCIFDSKGEDKIDRGLLLNERVLSRIQDFNRYENTDSGISPRSIPGMQNGTYLANSDEGDIKGYSSEDASNRAKKVEKRFRKVNSILKEMPDLNIYGDIKAKHCFVTWGSTKAPILEAMRRLQTIGISSKLLAFNYIEPFPKEEVEKFLKASKEVFLVENNFTSQLGKLIAMNTGYEIEKKILKYDGRPIYPDQIVNFVLTKSKN